MWFGKVNPKIIPADINKLIETKPNNLHFPGYVSSEDLREAYSGSDLYVFLTHEETEGIVLLEALATRADVLIRDIEIFADDFEDGVNIYKARNMDEIKNKIVGILEKKLPSLKEVSYIKAEEKSIVNTGKKLVECYEKVLNM